MPRATVDVSCELLAEVIFKRQVRVIKALAFPTELFVRLVIDGPDLPEPKEDGTPRRVNATVTQKVIFNAID